MSTFPQVGTHAFLGIRYAEPPVGEHRPGAGPARPWPGIRDAAEYGPTAPRPRQDFTLIPEPVVPGDDFLNLNLFTPDLGSANLPVLVWIHGGSFFSGWNRSPGYRGESFARDGAVLVSVNYRLGAEGSWTSTGSQSDSAAAIARTASVVTCLGPGPVAVGQVDSFTTTVSLGQCTNTFWPLTPMA
jgi:carboxylesterase type B